MGGQASTFLFKTKDLFLVGVASELRGANFLIHKNDALCGLISIEFMQPDQDRFSAIACGNKT